jgi:tetratricopeptide (TPR) repeat protein
MRLFVLTFVWAVLAAGCAGQAPETKQTGADTGSGAELSDRGEATTHLMLGEMAMQRGQLDEAATEYRLAAEAGSDPSVAERATDLALTLNNQDEALLSARRWYELAPEQEAAVAQYAILLMNAGETRLAAPVLGDLKQIYAATGEANSAINLLPVALQVEDSTVALETLKQVLGKRPRDAGSLVVLSSLYHVVDRNEEAEKLARAAVKADPNWVVASMQLARVLVGSGKVDEGLEIARKQAGAGADIGTRLDFASLLSLARDYETAGLILEQILLEHPGLPQALRLMGYVEFQSGRKENAKRYYTRLATTGTYFDEAYYFLGLIALDQGENDAAQRLFELVPEGDYFIASQFGVRDALVQLDKPEQAMEYLEQIAQGHPEHRVQMLIAQAELQAQLNRLDASIGLYRSALELESDNAQVRYGLAMALEQSGQIDQAIEMLEWMVKQDPDDSTALNALGYTLADHQRDMSRAYKYIRKAYELAPENPAVVDSMGWVEFRRGNNERALEYLLRAYELMQDPEIAAHLGEVLWVLGRQDEARSIWERAQELAPENDELAKVMERFLK